MTMSDAATPVHRLSDPEPPELHERNTWVGARLLVSSTVFLFLPFVFGYLYLASLNTSGLWRPGNLKAPIGWGTGIMVAVVVGAGLVAWARSELVGGRESTSRWLLLGGLVAGVAAVVLQCVEYTQLGFGPTDGGFASVFVGWTGLLAFVLLLTMVWLEMVVASSFRNGMSAPGSGPADVEALAFYLVFLAAVAVVTYGFLYLV